MHRHSPRRRDTDAKGVIQSGRQTTRRHTGVYMNILVTGGCGFIGSHLVDKLIAEKHNVMVLDNLEQQVHNGKMPAYANPKAEYIIGDVRDEGILKKSLDDIEIVFHEAAVVGVGQSMYQIRKYVDANSTGTANLLDAIVSGNYGIKKIIVASSMSIYGEGAYECKDCGIIYPELRPTEQLKNREWEMRCNCGKTAKPIPTPETKPTRPTSVYAITKKDQEELFLTVGRSYGIPAIALRYFNVYGTRQSMDNPYTGVAAIFSSRIKNDNPPAIFEDGLQSRDFISVHDIVRANLTALKNNNMNYDFFNVGTGRQVSIKHVAETLAGLYGKNIKPEIVGKFREGDIRHCFADITKIKRFGFEPGVTFENGMKELAEWGNKTNAKDMVDIALKELENRGLSK